jgi:excisionase family DNA binding protein
MSHFTLAQLSTKTGISRRHLQRLVAKGEIPGGERTDGGHWRVKKSAPLEGWLSVAAMKEAGRKSLSRDRAAPVRNSFNRFQIQMMTHLQEAIDEDKPLNPKVEEVLMNSLKFISAAYDVAVDQAKKRNQKFLDAVSTALS